MISTPTTARPPQARTLSTRPVLRNTVMIAAFTVVMIATGAVASAVHDPIVALVLGPALAGFVLWLYLLSTRRVEDREPVELAAPSTPRRVLTGTAIGALLSAVTIGLLALFGGYQITGWGSLSGALTVAAMMAAVAVAEEVLFRGVILRLVQQRGGTWIALAVSSVLFGLVHLLNPAATLWGALAIVIEAGLMLGAAYLATGSLWLAIGLHFGWNVTTVAVFGTVSSGSEMQGALVNATTSGPAWLSGGAFGPEGSIFAILVCTIASVVLLRLAHRRGRIVGRQRARA